MNDLISTILWKDKSKDLLSLLVEDVLKSVSPIDSGLEADVFQVSTPEDKFLLKVWNRDSKPDISRQYKLLEELYALGIAVSKQYGWGIDEHRNQVLLTSYDGTPINKVSKLKLTEVANI
ncbi:phosphotransferase [Paenibacillus spongiae]|uniref:Phosphotransferase n=1 Tax=Paenibacillus spongiae TaxID=2909671 RepID=A0ABY5SLJ6_9BACL|nr:phosphotransferase [Paenibacillus spongiae]UVI33118.1 phosphotransferase [Paenibacillus spongiae]